MTMKPKKIYTGFDYAYTEKHLNQWKKYKTNKLDKTGKYSDRISWEDKNPLKTLLKMYGCKERVEDLTVSVPMETLDSIQQQINKWALEKCLGVIGVRDYPVTDEVDKYLNGLLKQQRERARKEFSNE